MRGPKAVGASRARRDAPPFLSQRPRSTRLRWAFLVALGFAYLHGAYAQASPPRRGEGAEVLLLPGGPGMDLESVADAVEERGLVPLRVTGLEARMLRAAAAASDAEEGSRRAIEDALERIRASFLRQDYPSMLEELDAIESTALRATAAGQQCDLAFELEFQRGLAHSFRAGQGDGELAQRYYEAALSIDEKLQPSKELYGPDVLAEFLRARDNRARRLARQVRVVVTRSDNAAAVADAQVWVDCRPVSGRLLLRPGRHIVVVEAVGYATLSATIEQLADEPLSLSLDPQVGMDPAYARRWSEGRAEALAPTVLERIAELDRGAPIVLWISQSGEPTARIIREDGRGPVGKGTTTLAAAQDALRWVTSEGQIVVLRPRGDDPLAADVAPGDLDRKRRRRREIGKWVGLSVGVTAGVGLILGLGLGLGLDRTPDTVLQVVVE